MWPGQGKYFLAAGLIVLFLIMAAAWSPAAPRSSAPPPTNTAPVDEQTLIGSPAAWQAYGPPSGPVLIVFFVDFTCIHCRASWPAVQHLLRTYPTKVRFIFRDRTPTNDSFNLAMAANCAGEQGKYLDLANRIFTNQDAITQASVMQREAIAAGLDWSLFSACVNSQKYLNQIKRDMTDGQTLNLQGTPTWFINGQRVEGELTANDMDSIVTQLTH